MKKKLLFLLLVPVLVLCLTACGKAKDVKNIVLEDSRYGKTTFVSEGLKIKDVKKAKSSTSKIIKFTSEALNVKAEMYYTQVSNASYDKTRDARKTKTYYADSVYGKYTGYFYGDKSNKGNISVVLDTNDKGYATVLLISLEKIDTKDDMDMFTIVESIDMKKFLDSMTFEK